MQTFDQSIFNLFSQEHHHLRRGAALGLERRRVQAAGPGHLDHRRPGPRPDGRDAVRQAGGGAQCDARDHALRQNSEPPGRLHGRARHARPAGALGGAGPHPARPPRLRCRTPSTPPSSACKRDRTLDDRPGGARRGPPRSRHPAPWAGRGSASACRPWALADDWSQRGRRPRSSRRSTRRRCSTRPSSGGCAAGELADLDDKARARLGARAGRPGLRVRRRAAARLSEVGLRPIRLKYTRCIPNDIRASFLKYFERHGHRIVAELAARARTTTRRCCSPTPG